MCRLSLRVPFLYRWWAELEASSRQPTVEWQVAGACNYDCTYCIQSRKYRRGRPNKEQLEAALQTFVSLPGTWEIKCSGGEAFAHPLFLDWIVPSLMEWTEHSISVLTNFSASRRDLMLFAKMTRSRLRVFSASLHLEFVDVEAFASKAEWFVSMLEPSVGFVVNQVVLPGREKEAEKCRDAIEERGLRWFPQLFKQAGGVATYPDPKALLPIIGTAPSSHESNTAPSYKGRNCWAGVEYMVVDKDGSAWSCRTAKRSGEGRLGTVYDNSVVRWTEPSPCPYDICPCTVPANRGMIEGIEPRLETDE